MPVDRVVLLEPRGVCAGVDMAVQALAWLVLLDEPSLHCFHHVVHNEDFVSRFEQLGVTFCDRPEDIALGATVLLSAHGTGPATRAAIEARAGMVIDAVCPFVAKVHREINLQAREGATILYLGRRGHDETEGALEIAPERTILVEAPEDIGGLPEASGTVAVVAQTTLTIEEVERGESAAVQRFDSVWVPERSDVCDASTVRQAAVRSIAASCDAVVVVGSNRSSNTASLVESALAAGAPRALRVADAADLPSDLRGTIAVTAGASTPDHLVRAVVRRLGGPVQIVGVAPEEPRFALPFRLRRLIEQRTSERRLPEGIVALATSCSTGEALLSLAERMRAEALHGDAS